VCLAPAPGRWFSSASTQTMPLEDAGDVPQMPMMMSGQDDAGGGAACDRNDCSPLRRSKRVAQEYRAPQRRFSPAGTARGQALRTTSPIQLSIEATDTTNSDSNETTRLRGDANNQIFIAGGNTNHQMCGIDAWQQKRMHGSRRRVVLSLRR
jgi:hypothetical protein